MLRIQISQEAQKAAYAVGLTREARARQKYRVPSELAERVFALGGVVTAEGEVELDATSFLGARGRRESVYLPRVPAHVEDAVELVEAAAKPIMEAREAEERAEAEKVAEDTRVLEQLLADWPVSRIVEVAMEGGEIPAEVKKSEAPLDMKRDWSNRLDQAELALIQRVAEPALLLSQNQTSALNFGNVEVGPLTVRRATIIDQCPAVWEQAKEIAAQTKVEIETEAQRKREEIKSWLRTHATEDVVQRYAEDLLPEDEMLDIFRTVVFAPLDPFPRYRKIRASEIPCECAWGEVTPLFEKEPAKLTAEQYQVYCGIRAAAPEGVKFELSRHMGWCENCDEGVRRTSVLVSTELFGEPLSRAYALDEDSAA